jgi:hypothetical protein
MSASRCTLQIIEPLPLVPEGVVVVITFTLLEDCLADIQRQYLLFGPQSLCIYLDGDNFHCASPM